MMAGITESEVEDAALAWLAGLGYTVLHGPDIGPEGPTPERGSYDEVPLTGRLRKALARLNPDLLAETLEDVLQELTRLAKDINAAHRRGEEEGLSEEEVAFYDALAINESAVELMGNDHLRVIALELLNSLKGSASVDWQRRESARARMRDLVKRILRKHGYPPDLQDSAVQTVLQQVELLAPGWTAG